jgi:hypothetical protein
LINSHGSKFDNLRSTKQLRFKDTENLREILKEELMKYYALE